MSHTNKFVPVSSALALLLLVGCSASATPEGPFITPTPSPSVVSDADVPEITENPLTDRELDQGQESEPTEAEQMPFQYDWRTYEVSQEAIDRWGEEPATNALPFALNALNTAYHLENVWAEGPRVIEDFEAVREYLSPEHWERITTIIEDKYVDPHPLLLLMLYREPHSIVVAEDGTEFTPDTTPPVTFMVQNPRMTIVQDKEYFGDLEHRYTFGGTFTHQLFGTDENGERHSVTYQRDIALYLLPVGDSWVIDGWYATDMIPVKGE